jgi:hypothetical protein
MSKGQIKPKADWRRRFSKKIERTNLVFFAVKSKKAKKQSTARQSAYGFI